MTQLTEEQQRQTKKPPERLWLIPTTTGWLHEFDTPYAGDDGVEYVRKRVNTSEALAQIRQRQEERRARCELTVKGTDIPLPQSIPDIDFLLSLLDTDRQATVLPRGAQVKVITDIDPWFEQVNDMLSYVSMCPHDDSLHIKRQDFEALQRLVEAEAQKRGQRNRKPLLDSPDKD